MVIITDSAIQFSLTNEQTAVYPAIGTILLWGGNNSNDLNGTDYLICDGSEVLKVGQYGTLYGVVGDKYGPATAGYFKLPDLRQRIPIGANNTTTIQYNSTYYGGVNKLVPAHYPHQHILTNFTYTEAIGRRGAETVGGDLVTCNAIGTTNTNNAPPFISSTGDPNNSENYYPPYTLVNYIIKAKTTPYTS